MFQSSASFWEQTSPKGWSNHSHRSMYVCTPSAPHSIHQIHELADNGWHFSKSQRWSKLITLDERPRPKIFIEVSASRWDFGQTSHANIQQIHLRFCLSFSARLIQILSYNQQRKSISMGHFHLVKQAVHGSLKMFDEKDVTTQKWTIHTKQSRAARVLRILIKMAIIWFVWELVLLVGVCAHHAFSESIRHIAYSTPRVY